MYVCMYVCMFSFIIVIRRNRRCINRMTSRQVSASSMEFSGICWLEAMHAVCRPSNSATGDCKIRAVLKS